MAIFRKIHVSFWSDAFISELNDKSKLFYLYLITNERTTQLGVYEITKKQMAYDLGYSIDTVSKLLLEMQKANRIRFNEQTSEIALRNWNRYNHNPSIKVKSLVDKESSRIKDKSLIEYAYCIDTVSIHNTQEEEEQTEEQDPEKTEDSPPAEIPFLEQIDLNPFSENFRSVWNSWIDYKKNELKKSFKLLRTQQAAFRHLVELAKSNEITAQKIIEQSIANQWTGLFELKNNNNGSGTKQTRIENFEQGFREQFAGKDLSANDGF